MADGSQTNGDFSHRHPSGTWNHGLDQREHRARCPAQGATNLLAVSHSTSNVIDRYLFAHYEDVTTTSAFPEIVAFVINPRDNTTKANALQVLKTLVKKTDYESIAIADRDGNIILSSSEQDLNTNIKSSPYFAEPMKGIVGYISDPAVSVVTNKPALFFGAAIRDPAGQALGVLVSRLSLSGIWTIVENDLDAAGPGTVGILLDEYGLRLAHSNVDERGETLTKTMLGIIKGGKLLPYTEK